MVPEARIQQTDTGAVVEGKGWYVLNAHDATWRAADGRGAYADLEAGTDFDQVGVGICTLGPGEPMAMYHWEADQEDFLVVAGEAILIVEGQERPLRAWDFVHCPPNTRHVIVGAGSGQCVIVAIGARDHQDGDDWGAYPVDDTALRHNAGVEQETNKPEEAYAHVQHRKPTRYRDGWLPD